MRITRIAVFAGKFASAIGVDGPIERYTTGFALVENGFHRQQKIFRALARPAARGCSRRNRSEAGDADQRRSTVRCSAWYSVCCGLSRNKDSTLPEILHTAEWVSARSGNGGRRAIRAATVWNAIWNDAARTVEQGTLAGPCLRAMIGANRKERS